MKKMKSPELGLKYENLVTRDVRAKVHFDHRGFVLGVILISV